MQSSFFWGIVLICIGLSLICKTIFGFSLPILRIALAAFLMYMGMCLLFGTCFKDTHCLSMFTHHKKHGTPAHGALLRSTTNAGSTLRSCTILFGHENIDLSQLPMPNTETHLDIQSTFGSIMIWLNPAIPTKLIINSTFSTNQLPDTTVITKNGNHHVASIGPADRPPLLIINAHTVFSTLSIAQK